MPHRVKQDVAAVVEDFAPEVEIRLSSRRKKTLSASCSTDTGRIRISHYLKDVPDYVLDQVIVHELVHTFIPNHSAEFYAWAHRVDYWERADGYLEAYQRWGRGGGHSS
ncbi:MAG: M48 family metallopeptidase [Corynebacterium kroppenstedtii]|nr:M48 family metallopeptidase [Corynebacterium kroppenstedtii]